MAISDRTREYLHKSFSHKSHINSPFPRRAGAGVFLTSDNDYTVEQIFINFLFRDN